jgi:putative transposase
LLSKTAVSKLEERLWEDYQVLHEAGSKYEFVDLFVDGIAERLRPGGKREPMLAAWGYTIEGKMRGLNAPLLITSDGAPGIIKAIEVCFPRATRKPCLEHRMRNLASKVPEELWPEFKARVQAIYQAPKAHVPASRDSRA